MNFISIQQVIFISINLFVFFDQFVVFTFARHIDWALNNGATIHPSLQYYNNGMYAIHGPISSGDILVSLPSNLEFKCENCSLEEFTNKFKIALKDETNFWNKYLKSLPSSCQNPLCAEPNKTLLTRSGYTFIKRVLARPMSNESSIIVSRRWKTGMLPVMDLFNHNSKFGDIVRPSEDGNEYLLIATKSYAKGEEVYTHYGLEKTIFQMYNRYGFIIDDQELSCADIRMMRIGDIDQRIECIVNSSTTDITIEQMVNELSEAYVQKDYTMMKAAAKWLDRNIQI